MSEGLRDRAIEELTHPLSRFRPWEWEGRSPQRDFVRAAGTHRFRIYRGGNQGGKEQPVTEPILTPRGWRKIGDLRPGDLVISEDGRPSPVSGVFPQGRRPVFRVTFDDGASTECGLDHLWKVRDREGRFPRAGKAGEWRVMSLREIMDRWGADPSPVQRVAIPVPVAVDLEPRRLALDPYVMGVLLGDGCLRGQTRLTSADPWIVQEVTRLLPAQASIAPVRGTLIEFGIRGLLPILRLYGVQGKGSWQKFVPVDYLINSVENRLAVLQGLMDTDGTVGRNGQVSFCSTSRRLAEDVQLLVRSLGGKAAIKSRFTSFTYKGERKAGRESFMVRVRLPIHPAFRLERKLARCFRPTSREDYRVLRKIEPAGEAECVCIAVDHPSRTYVTRDFVVTHNTTVGVVDTALRVTGRHPFARYKPPVIGWVSALDWEFGIGQVIWPKLKEWILPSEIRAISWLKKGAIEIPTKILFKNGSELIFKSAESGRKKYQGAPIHFFWGDEEHEADLVEEAQARLLKHAGDMYWTLTPVMRKAWVQEMERMRGPDGKPACAVIRSSSTDAARAGVIGGGDPASVEAFFANLPERQRRVRELGDFVQLEGLVYPSFDRGIHVLRPKDGKLVGNPNHDRERPWPLPKEWRRFASIDFGMTVPTAVLVSALDPFTDTLIFYRCYYQAGIHASKWAAILKGPGAGGEPTLPDLSRALIADHDAQARAELHGQGIGTSPAAKHDTKTPGIEAVERCLVPSRKDGLKIRFVLQDSGPPVHPELGRCDTDKLVWEIEGYHYPKVKENAASPVDEPVKRDDHALDAMRYQVWPIEREVSASRFHTYAHSDIVGERSSILGDALGSGVGGLFE